MENGLDISSSTAFMNDIAEIWRYSLNLCTGEVVHNNLTPQCWTDFPVVPKQHVGLPTRYCYSPENDPVEQSCASAKPLCSRAVQTFAPNSLSNLLMLDIPPLCLHFHHSGSRIVNAGYHT